MVRRLVDTAHEQTGGNLPHGVHHADKREEEGVR